MKCECADNQCPCAGHVDGKGCTYPGKTIMYRIDMHDETGTVMCHDCYIDAIDSGLFTDMI